MSLINDEEFRAVFCEVLHKRGIATNDIAIDALKEKIQHDQEVELNIWSKNQNQSDPFTLTQWIQEANKKRELVAAVEDQIDSNLTRHNVSSTSLKKLTKTQILFPSDIKSLIEMFRVLETLV